MANPLARQMLSNLANQAGQQTDGRGNPPGDGLTCGVRLDVPEEQRLVDLIHRRQALIPSNPRKNLARDWPPSSSRKRMVSLEELAAKARNRG